MIGLEFRVVPPEVDESLGPAEQAEGYVTRLAREKATTVAGRERGAVVLAADTTVVLRGTIFGKPANPEEAAEMLRQLEGRKHQVMTAVAVALDRRVEHALDVTDVTFRPLTDAQIAAYVATGEPLDKAGAYAIQGKGAALVEGIRGDFFGVMGLPLRGWSTGSPAVAEDWGHVFNGEANIDRWSPRVAEVLRDQGITKLRIREGWQEPGLDPLVPFGDQITRIFVECDVPDLSALGQLRRLRELAMREGLATIDFTGLDQLEDLTTSGDTPRFGNLPEARALRRLHVVNCGLRDLTPLSALGHLAELEISEAPLKTLAGVDGLRSLRRLGLFQVPLRAGRRNV